MATEYARKKGYVIEHYYGGDSDNYLRLQIRNPRTNKIVSAPLYECQLAGVLKVLPDISDEVQKPVKPKKQKQSQYL